MPGNLIAKSFSLKFRNNPFFFPLFPLSLFLFKTGKKLENSRVLIPFRFIFFSLIENEWGTRRSRRKLVDSSFISSLLRSLERKNRKWTEPLILFFSWSPPYLPSSFFIHSSLLFMKNWRRRKKCIPLLFFSLSHLSKMKGISHYFFFTFSCLFLL